MTSKALCRPGQPGGECRAIDAIFRALPIVVLPGYSRPLIRAQDYLELVERCRYDTLCGSSTRVCGGLRKHTFEIHKSLGQGCVQIGDLAVQLGRGHE